MKIWFGGKVDGYPEKSFVIPKKRRRLVMELFREFQVTACFSGHFHQNLISKSSFGMPMIVTSSLSLVYNSTGKPKQGAAEPNTRGLRIVSVAKSSGVFEIFPSIVNKNDFVSSPQAIIVPL